MDPSHDLGSVRGLGRASRRAGDTASRYGDRLPPRGLAQVVRTRLAPLRELSVVEDAGCMFTDGEGGLLGVAATGPTARALATIEELAERGPCHHTLGLTDDEPDDAARDRSDVAADRRSAAARTTTQVYDLTARWPFDRLLGPEGSRRVLTRPVHHAGRAIGVCFATSNALRPWTPDELAVLTAVTDQVDRAVADALRVTAAAAAPAVASDGGGPQRDDGGPQRDDGVITRILDSHRTADERARAVAIIRRRTGLPAAAARRRLRQMAVATDVSPTDVARELVAADDLPRPDAMAVAATDRGHREELARLALTDPLTGLPNRVLLLDRLEHAVWRSARGAGHPGVVYLDLDGFKTVNDELGHDVGDHVLRTAASRIVSAVRPQDTVARLGGDEFAVVCEAIDRDDAVDVARRIARALDAPLEPTREAQQDAPTVSAHDDPARPHHLEHLSTIRASIGVAIAHPGQQAAEVLRDADTAMYRSKTGGDAITVFQPAMGRARTRRLRLSADLPDTIAGSEFELTYVPIVELATSRITGLEAVVRWDHPAVGLVDRAEIDAIAAPAGLATSLTESVLHRVGATAAGWRHDGEPPRDLAVTLAAADLADPRCGDLVLAALQARGLPPSQLCLEVREQDVRASGGLGIETLLRLHVAGVVLVLDGVGTGSCTLPSLTDLPIRVLRLAPALVATLHTRQAAAVARAVIGLARDLDLRVLAAGVTTTDQHVRLVELGCERAQGAYYGPDVDPVRVPARVSAGPGGPVEDRP